MHRDLIQQTALWHRRRRTGRCAASCSSFGYVRSRHAYTYSDLDMLPIAKLVRGWQDVSRIPRCNCTACFARRQAEPSRYLLSIFIATAATAASECVQAAFACSPYLRSTVFCANGTDNEGIPHSVAPHSFSTVMCSSPAPKTVLTFLFKRSKGSTFQAGPSPKNTKKYQKASTPSALALTYFKALPPSGC